MFEPRDIGLVRPNRRLIGSVPVHRVVPLLSRNRTRLHQILVPRRCDLRQVEIGFRGAQISPRLPQRLIEFRGFDFCQQLAFADARANVNVPPPEIAVGPGVDRRIDERLCIARQH